MKHFVITLSLVTMTGIVAVAQPIEPPPPGVPISGVEILLIAGGLLGFKKIMGSKKGRHS